jgi:CDP-diacylglycerol--serine O-phosphatidyltransferase
MKRYIPNFITCLNLISGCFSVFFAVKGMLEIASLFILVAAAFDFLDGFFARLLKVQSPIGVDMDSLADLCSFGIAPAMILLTWMQQCLLNQPLALQESAARYLVYIAFIIPALSAVRLAKFNHDERQKSDFTGLPTPANALFLGFLHFLSEELTIVNNFWVLATFAIIFSLLLVSNLSMFSLKFKTFGFKENRLRYIFLAISLILLSIMQFGAFPIIILCYILLSLGSNLWHKTVE